MSSTAVLGDIEILTDVMNCGTPDFDAAEPQTLWFWSRDAARERGLRRGCVGRRGGRRARWAFVPSEIHAVSERRASNADDGRG